MPKVPRRLERDPIVEALFELRFKSSGTAAADVLQSSIYPAFKDRLPNLNRTPLGSLPVAVLESNPELRYQARLVLQGDLLAVFIGDHSVAISCRRPYLGWSKFRPLILELLNNVKSSGVATEPERFSLKYINLLEGDTPVSQFSLTRYVASLGKHDLRNYVTYTRTEIIEEGHTVIVELGANSIAKLPKGPPLSGLIFTIDTINKAPAKFWEDPAPIIDKAHDVEKAVFFGMLTDAAIEKMGPEY